MMSGVESANFFFARDIGVAIRTLSIFDRDISLMQVYHCEASRDVSDPKVRNRRVPVWIRDSMNVRDVYSLIVHG